MLENAYYAVLSPEGFASILWKDPQRRGEACEVMKLTAQDLSGFGVIDEIVPEPLGGAQREPERLFAALDEAIARHLHALDALDADALTASRYQKYRAMGL